MAGGDAAFSNNKYKQKIFDNQLVGEKEKVVGA